MSHSTGKGPSHQVPRDFSSAQKALVLQSIGSRGTTFERLLGSLRPSLIRSELTKALNELAAEGKLMICPTRTGCIQITRPAKPTSSSKKAVGK